MMRTKKWNFKKLMHKMCNKPKNVIRSESMLFLMAVIRKTHWQDIVTQDIGNIGA